MHGSLRSIISLTLFLTSAAGLLSGCGEHHASHAAEPAKQTGCSKNELIKIASQSTLAALRYDTASVRPMEFVIEASGQLQANANAVTRISAPVSGKVIDVHAAVGDAVKPGQLLATITSQEVGALVTDLYKTEADIDSELQSDLLDLDCNVKQAKAEMALCQKQYDRANLLLQEKIGSLAAVESTNTDLEKHKLTIGALEEKRASRLHIAAEKKRLAHVSVEQKLLLLGLPKETISHILNSHSVMNSVPLRAPQGGFVLERNLNTGELIDSSKILFVIDDIDTLWLVADVFEQDIERVQSGESIEFKVDSFPKETFTGKLDFVAGTINPETRTLPVRAVISNPHLKLKPKMFARMKILAGSHKVLAIPRTAVQEAGSQKVVYLPVDGGFQERQVVLGEECRQYVEVRSGLKDHERVVTDGSFWLRSQSLKQVR